jgi:hypothetical protein
MGSAVNHGSLNLPNELGEVHQMSPDWSKKWSELMRSMAIVTSHGEKKISLGRL